MYAAHILTIVATLNDTDLCSLDHILTGITDPITEETVYAIKLEQDRRAAAQTEIAAARLTFYDITAEDIAAIVTW